MLVIPRETIACKLKAEFKLWGKVSTDIYILGSCENNIVF